MRSIEPTEQDYAALERTLLARAAAEDRRRTLQRRVTIIGAIGLVGVAGMGAAWAVLANPVLRDNAAYCYSEPDPNSAFVTAGAPAAEAPDGTIRLQEADALDMCAAVWRIGAVGPHATQPPVDGIEYEIPPLEACLRLDGVTAVFPNEQREAHEPFCRRLGLAPND
ncbi:hypothetical protein [Agromyces bracchium]|uniref:Uncharacterized protein n=1 Tax=Agromyces bracchium TaxID=88376 RepID=A0A6I3MDZ5_9MICO|nr:hypothetical protein [Agromyces bracchium]MTH70217.1 hypothetical protein [Agromyces bracchium]